MRSAWLLVLRQTKTHQWAQQGKSSRSQRYIIIGKLDGIEDRLER